jgi:Spy/CpxP family protein refolding chaperone
MRKLLALLVGAALVVAVAIPLSAHGPGWGRGHHMMGPWGSAPGYSWQYERGYGELSEEQRSRLQELDRKFYRETADLRNKIWEKSSELSTLLNSADPDPEKVRAEVKICSGSLHKLSLLRASPLCLGCQYLLFKIHPVKRSCFYLTGM